MIHRNKHSESKSQRSHRRLGFDRPFRNSQRYDSQFEGRDSEFNRSDFQYDRDADRPNRYGEGRIYRDYYDDEYGMRHPFTQEEREHLNWSHDSRSEAANETHYGKGPKNYRRDDRNIQEDICEAMMRNADLDASQVDVKVEQGHVTLSGEVEDRRSKRLAEDIVDTVRGVMDVFNRLSVKSTTDGWNKGMEDLNRLTE